MLSVPSSAGWLLLVSEHVLQQSRRQTQNVVVLIREFASTQKLSASSTDGGKGTQRELGVKLRRVFPSLLRKLLIWCEFWVVCVWLWVTVFFINILSQFLLWSVCLPPLLELGYSCSSASLRGTVGGCVRCFCCFEGEFVSDFADLLHPSCLLCCHFHLFQKCPFSLQPFQCTHCLTSVVYFTFFLVIHTSHLLSETTDDYWSWRFPNADERNVNSASVKCSVNVCKVPLLYNMSQLRCFLAVDLEEQPSG